MHIKRYMFNIQGYIFWRPAWPMEHSHQRSEADCLQGNGAGDSGGEGGSGQRVLGPVGFHCVLARLLDGGLICTDGSNAGYCDRENGKYAPWNALTGIRPFSPPIKGSSFEYFSRRFTCLTVLERARPVCIWQVAGWAAPPRK